MAAVHELVVRHTVETLTEEIASVVAERRRLHAAAAGHSALEANRLRLLELQAGLSQVLIQQHLGQGNAVH